MAINLAPKTSQSQLSCPGAGDQISVLGSTIIDGLVVCGLAATGMRPRLPEQTAPLVPGDRLNAAHDGRL
jgi:hypothetical protein